VPDALCHEGRGGRKRGGDWRWGPRAGRHGEHPGGFNRRRALHRRKRREQRQDGYGDEIAFCSNSGLTPQVKRVGIQNGPTSSPFVFFVTFCKIRLRDVGSGSDLLEGRPPCRPFAEAVHTGGDPASRKRNHPALQ